MLGSAITSDQSLHSPELLGKEIIMFLCHKELSKSTLLERLNLFGNSQAKVVILWTFFSLELIKSGEFLKYLKPYMECEENSWQRLLNSIFFISLEGYYDCNDFL